MIALRVQPLTRQNFSQFGDILDCTGSPDKIINQGRCGRFHDLAEVDVADGRAGISLFKADLRRLPLTIDMMERHPRGSQAFIPMCESPFLVIVALDQGGAPGKPMAFQTKGGQGVNYHRNIWHGVLTPLSGSGIFAVVDRIGAGENLEEHWFNTPYQILE